jgi:3-oxoacyl-[acyl-carrier-protein] synthase II
MIQRGDADLMVAGGCSSLTTPYGVMAFALLGSLSKANVSRPFDASRDGFVIAEGAGVVILEEWEHARARGARIYGELVGYGCTANAYRITDSPPDGESEAYGMALALRDAGIRPEEVDYIAAHGTSTRQNDRTETLAVKRVFGEHAGRVRVSSNKSMLGHTIAAAGVLSLIFSVLAIRDGVVPPTINYRSPDPRCDLDYVPNEARPMPVRCAIVNAFAFGGHNTTLVVRRADS